VPVLRQWSDAVAAAGLFTEALRIHPAVRRADLVRRAELAVLAGDHKLALHLLAELERGTSARSSKSNPAWQSDGGARRKGGKSARLANPWLVLLTRSAQLLAGQPDRLGAVLTAAKRVQPSAGVSWVVALAGASAGNLEAAGPAADDARAGGCRDLRMLSISAAARAADGDDSAALDLVGRALRIALPAEDPAGFTIELLDRAGSRAAAQRLSALGAGSSGQSAAARAAWRASARLVGAGHKGALRRSLTAAGSLDERLRDRLGRRWQAESLRDLTCRCYGSAGWVGQQRLYYVTHHLNEVLPEPVPGLSVRLLRCRATNLSFLDFGERQLTLPVVSETALPAGRDAVSDQENDREADPDTNPEADPEVSPTPGMSVSLGAVLPA
jgi:hypothetical protein